MDFKNYLVPGKTGLLIGIGGVSMCPLAEVLAGKTTLMAFSEEEFAA